jgi:hypothetical protein
LRKAAQDSRDSLASGEPWWDKFREALVTLILLGNMILLTELESPGRKEKNVRASIMI